MKRPFDAVVWWEIRRIPYNLIMAIAGIAALLVVLEVGSRLARPGEDFIEPVALLFGAVAYAIMANLFYTMTWITEISGAAQTRAAPKRCAPRYFAEV
jgi:hypothetical protein